LSGLADIYNSRGEYMLAAPLYKRAIASVEKSQAVPLAKDPLRKEILRKLAELYEQQGLHEHARMLYERAVAEK